MSLDLPSHTSSSAVAWIHTQWDVVLRCYHILDKHFFFIIFVRGLLAICLFVCLSVFVIPPLLMVMFLSVTLSKDQHLTLYMR